MPNYSSNIISRRSPILLIMIHVLVVLLILPATTSFSDNHDLEELGLILEPLENNQLSSHVTTTTTTTTQDLEEKSPNLHPLIYLHGYNGHNNFKGSSCLHMKKQRRKLDVCTMMIVDKIDGVGDFTTVQAAVHAVPDWSSVRTTIHIHEGIYK